MPFKSDNARIRYFAENVDYPHTNKRHRQPTKPTGPTGIEPPNKRICPLCKGSKPTNLKICIPCLRKKQLGTKFHPDFNNKLHDQHSRGFY